MIRVECGEVQKSMQCGEFGVQLGFRWAVIGGQWTVNKVSCGEFRVQLGYRE